MKRILVLLAIAALAIPTAASAKGPAGATIEGPGIAGAINVPGSGENEVYEDEETRGGWYTAGIPALRVRLIEAHLLPSAAPAEAKPVDEVALLSTEKLIALAGAMGLVFVGTAIFLRRRTLTAT